MYLVILNVNTSEMRALLGTYLYHLEDSDLSKTRLSQLTRRACSLALTRNLLVENQILTMDSAKQTTIQHYESGEPYLVFPKGDDRHLHISISHSGQWCACIISEGEQPAGLDLEDLHIQRDFLRLAKSYFSPSEIEYVRQYGKEAFYKLWTSKEAIAKLQGKGLAEALKIRLVMTSSDINSASFGSPGYYLTQHLTQDYIYTIARKDFAA